MRMSETTSKIFTALIQAQSELKNPHKSAENPHFRSGFAPLDEIIDSIKPTLKKHGLGVVQDLDGDVDETVVSTMIIHDSGEFIIQEGLVIPLVKKDAHGACGAVSYARRYALLAMLNIVGTNDDDDGLFIATDKKAEIKKTKGNFLGIQTALNSAPTVKAISDIQKLSEMREWTEEEEAKIDILVNENMLRFG